MEQQGSFRREKKYRISVSDYLALRQRLRPVMKPDPHAGADGTYSIHSIYFDNYQEESRRRGEAGKIPYAGNAG